MVTGKRVVAFITGVVVTGYAWNVATSAILCAVIQRMELFQPPFLQWLDAAALFSAVSWTIKTWIVLAPLIPSTVVFIGAAALVRRWRPASLARAKLYGASRWASDADMRRGGIRQSRSPF